MVAKSSWPLMPFPEDKLCVWCLAWWIPRSILATQCLISAPRGHPLSGLGTDGMSCVAFIGGCTRYGPCVLQLPLLVGATGLPHGAHLLFGQNSPAQGHPQQAASGTLEGKSSQIIFSLGFQICLTLDYAFWDCLILIAGFSGGSDGKVSACNVGDPGSIPGSGRSPGEGNDNPLQYSCLENPMDGGAW